MKTQRTVGVCLVAALYGCQSMSHRPTQVNFGAEVLQTKTGEYHLKLNASPSASLDDARAQWHQEAVKLCESGQVETEVTSTETNTYYSTVRTAGANVSNNAAVTMCTVGGIFGCGFAVLLASPGEKTTEIEYPVVEGTVSCKN